MRTSLWSGDSRTRGQGRFLNRKMVSTQPLANAHVLAQPAWKPARPDHDILLKPARPDRDEGAVRVETNPRVSEDSWPVKPPDICDLLRARDIEKVPARRRTHPETSCGRYPGLVTGGVRPSAWSGPGRSSREHRQGNRPDGPGGWSGGAARPGSSRPRRHRR